MTKRSYIKHFPTDRQLSLAGLELCFIDYVDVKEYVTDLAYKRLRRALKTKGTLSLEWHEATSIADSDLLRLLHAYGKIQCAKECPPWVVYIQ